MSVVFYHQAERKPHRSR
jgi:hypothetical protein